MFEIRGLDKLTKDLSNAKRAFAKLDGELGSVGFDPNEPGSIEAAISKIEKLVDDKIQTFASNPIVGPMAKAMKEKYRNSILERAASMRLKNI